MLGSMARSRRAEEFEVYELAATAEGGAVDLLALEADVDAHRRWHVGAQHWSDDGYVND
jgi:hypothetical protein